MKVAINRCFGGFSISGKAAKILAMKECPLMETHTYKDWYGSSEPSDYEKWEEFGDGFEIQTFGSKPTDTLRKDGLIYNFDGREGDRSHPDLIQVIEDLGEEANGNDAKIEIVEIPDGVEYTIEEYDGMEHVAEKHRTWS